MEEWCEYDRDARDEFAKCKESEEFARWFRIYGKTTYNRAIGRSWADVVDKNTKEAIKFCESLEAKVVDITGEIIEWSLSPTDNSLYSCLDAVGKSVQMLT